MRNKILTSECPDCSRINTYHFTSEEIEAYGIRVVYCDPEDGGCDQDYAIAIAVKTYVKTYKLVATK